MVVNELSKATFTITPLDENGNKFTPTNIRFRVDDKTSGASLIAWTAATASTSVEIEVPPAANAIIDSSKPEEEKVLTVETDFGTNDAHTEERVYTVKNLQFIS